MKILKRHLFLCPFLLFGFVYAQQTGTWQLLKTKNKANGRSECGFAAVNGKLYLIGGDGPAEPVEVFDPATLTWSKKATAPVVLHHFQAVSLGNKVYVLDAFYEGGFPNQDPAPNAYSYNVETDTWQKLAGLPAERRRAGAGAAAYQGKLYLVAGIRHGHSSGTTNMFDVYDPKTDTWAALPDAPHIRDHSMAVVVGDKLYAVGGRNTSYRDPNNIIPFFRQVMLDVDCYNFKTGIWKTLDAKLPMGTGGGTAVNLDGKIFYIGGERATDTLPNGPQKDVYCLDPKTLERWVKVSNLNMSRNGVGGTVLDHKIYIAGGSGGGPGGPPPPNGQMQGPPPNNGNNPNGPPPNPPAGNRPPSRDEGIAIEVFSFK